MSRTSMGIVAGVILLGFVVAMLPAQESSRRTAKYRPGSQPAERPNLSPGSEADLPPIVMPSGRLMPPPANATRLSDPRNSYNPAGQLSEQPATSDSGTSASALVPPDTVPSVEQSVISEPAARTDPDDNRLHSVLKRSPQPGSLEQQGEARPPASDKTGDVGIAQPTELPANVSPAAGLVGELPRRPTSTITSQSMSAATATRMSSGANSSAKPVQNITATSKSAALKVDIAGPSGLTVGKPAPYFVNVSNESDTAADEVLVRIPLPSFVTVQGTQPSSGEAGVQGDALGGSRLVWSVPRIAGRGREQLKLHLVTREGDSFDLTAEWTCRPAVAKAAIVVKQPQLALSLAGPADMVFGEEKTFTLTVSNPGN